jgi:hypothetical protein
MENVVKSCHLYATFFEKGKVKVFSGYLLSPIKIIAQNPDSLREYGKIDFKYDKNKQIVVLNKKYICTMNEFLKTPYGNLKFVPNKYYIPHLVIQSLFPWGFCRT